jgi:hypothetical protein
MVDWIIPLVVGVLIAGGVLAVPLLMRSKSRGSNQQTNNSKSDALPPNPNIAPPDQNIVSDSKDWLRKFGWGALRVLGQVAVGITGGVIILIVIMLLMRPMTPVLQ